jgi:amino acid transporter
MTVSTPQSHASAPAPTALRRHLGTGSIVFMVVAAAAPMTVVVATFPLIFSISATVAAPAYFLAAGVILILFSVGFTVMSKYVKNAGAFYSYIQAGLGRPVGSGAALLALVSYAVLLVGVNAYVGVAANNVIAHFTGFSVPWWVWAIISLAIIAFLGYRRIELSSRVLAVALIVETLAVVILDIGIIGHGGKAGLTGEPFAATAWTSGAPGLGLMFAFLAFFGFEATAVFRNEARDPDRTIPRATYVAVITIALLYAISSWAVAVGAGTAGAVKTATKDPENFVLNLASTYVSPILQDAMQILVATSLFACVLSFHNVIARYAYTLGDKGILPATLGKVHPKHQSPARASLVTSIVAVAVTIIAALAQMDPVVQIYTWFTGAATLGIIVLMATTCLAVVVFFRRHGHDKRIWHTLIAPILGFLGLAVVLILVLANYPFLTGSVASAVIIALLLLLVFVLGVVLALVMRSRRHAQYLALEDDQADPGDPADPADPAVQTV